MNFKDAMVKAAEDYGLMLTTKQLSAFETYFNLLIEWNEKINLTAITEPQAVAVKHMIDSLSCYREDVFTADAKIIDVGTGAGFPGLPLKIFQPQLILTLLDSLNKRVRFLECAVDELALKGVCCVHARAEEGARMKGYRENFDVAVSRAVARLPILCEYCLPFVRKGGYFVALKGLQYKDEMREAEKAMSILGAVIDEVRPIKLPGLDDIRAVIYIRKTGITPAIYPRKAGIPEKNSLGICAKKDFVEAKPK